MKPIPDQGKVQDNMQFRNFPSDLATLNNLHRTLVLMVK
jgi:hypothetical protein